MGVGDCDIFEAKLMQSQKEPRHLRRWADPIFLMRGEGGQALSEVDGERPVGFGCAVVLRNIFCESCRSLDLQRLDLIAVRYKIKNKKKKKGGEGGPDLTLVEKTSRRAYSCCTAQS